MTKLSQLSRSIAGKVALVTGAASGMGRATCHLFADEGARVVVTDVNTDGADAVAAEITGAGGEALSYGLDVSNLDNVREVVTAAVDRFGGMDILINNAGISRFSPILGDDYDKAWAETLAVNLTGEMQMIRACLPHLQRGGAGRIVNIASTEGLGATALGSPYTASKHGVVGLTRSLAVELGDQGVTVNCICPGPINTGMTQVIPDDAKRKFARRRVPLRRYGDPEEVAHATLSLVLPASSFINGAILPVDGGLVVQNT
ncbi:MAG: SDR family oxidoreductase [bacterium]|nr:SDR family oxidoreductase [bacterium]